MITTGYVNGNIIGLYINGTLVAYGLGCTLSGSTNIINVSNNESSGIRDIIPDEDQVNMKFNGIMRFDASYGLSDIINAWKNRTNITAKIASTNSDDPYYQITGKIEDFELTADYGNRAEFSFSIPSIADGLTLLKQYDYYTSDTQYNIYSGIGVAETYYDGTTYVRKVIQSGVFKRQISTDGVNWSNLDPTYTIQNDGVRNGVRSGSFVADATITTIGFSGVKDTDWETLEEITAGGTGKFREGVRNGAYVIDQALTALGFDGIENTDWENIIEMKIT